MTMPLDPRVHQFRDGDVSAPLPVVARVTALLPEGGLVWRLAQTWADDGSQRWRVLGLTDSLILFVDASRHGGTSWAWNLDDKAGDGEIHEAWACPRADILALHCDDTSIHVDRSDSQVTMQPDYSVAVRGRDVRVPVSARPVPTWEDAEQAAEFANLVRAAWHG